MEEKREEALSQALLKLRSALDSPDWMSSDDIESLHEAEELLSQALSAPAWEGRE